MGPIRLGVSLSAIAENLDYVLVFEDDADWFASNFKSSFDGLLDDVRKAPEKPNDLVYSIAPPSLC